MTTIEIVRENIGVLPFRALAGDKESGGRTAGEALDALTAQLNEEEAGTLVIVQQYRPDRFFNALQQARLSELMTRWRTARDADTTLPADEQAELDTLIEQELAATVQRAQTILQERPA
jgi:hypothetical protein